MSYKRDPQKLKKRKRTSAKLSFDENKEINVAVKTGKTLIGTKSVLRELSMGDLKLLIIANNTPKHILDKINLLNNCLETQVPIFTSKNSSWDLGAVCAKPFWVTTVGIKSAGNSSILKVIK